MAGHLIVGLDVSTRARAEEIVTALGDSVDYYKIGYQCFYGADGFALGKDLIAAGKKVFFDLKLLDIDNTVEKGVAAIAATGAAMKPLRSASWSALGRTSTVARVGMPLACSQTCWASWSAAGRTCTVDRVLMASEACHA